MEEGKRTILIFPPLRLGRRMLERVSSLFGTPTICLPWQMEPPFENAGATDQKSFDIVRPPRDMMPPEYFPRLLAEYRTWTKDNPGRGGSAFLAAARELYAYEDTRWEIQRMVRKGTGDGDSGDPKTMALKWHLILHLASAMEKEAGEAEGALRRLKKQGSPLKEALGEDPEGPGFLEDISPSLAQPVFESDILRDICDSWVCLFGTFIQKGQLLVTLDERIKNYVRDLFVEAASRVDLIQPVSTIHFRVPDPLSFSFQGPGISGMQDIHKSVMLVINRILRDLWNQNSKHSDDVDSLIADMESKFPAQGAPSLIGVEILSLPAVSGSPPSQTQTILDALAGKSLAFVREVSNNG